MNFLLAEKLGTGSQPEIGLTEELRRVGESDLVVHSFVFLLLHLKATVSTSVLICRTFLRGKCAELGGRRTGYTISVLGAGLV